MTTTPAAPSASPDTDAIATGRQTAVEQLRKNVGELFSAERRFRYREQRLPGGLTLNQLQALTVLDVKKTVSAGELAKSAGLNPASITAMLDQLESVGIVERARSTSDRRICMVILTEKGRETLARTRDLWEEIWERQMASLSEEELRIAVKVNRLIVETFNTA